MDLATLIAMYPIAKELINKTPRVREWIEKKAKEEDPALFLQLQSVEEIRSLKAYALNTSIISAVLSDPDLSEDQIRDRILKGAKIAKSIADELKTVSP